MKAFIRETHQVFYNIAEQPEVSKNLNDLKYKLSLCSVNAKMIGFSVHLNIMLSIKTGYVRIDVFNHKERQDKFMIDIILNDSVWRELPVEINNSHQAKQLHFNDRFYMLNYIFILHHVQLVNFIIPLIIKFYFTYIPRNNSFLKLQCFFNFEYVFILAFQELSFEYQIKEFFIHLDFNKLTSKSFNPSGFPNITCFAFFFFHIDLIIVYFDVINNIIDHDAHSMRFKLRNIIETDLLESGFDYKYEHSNTIHEVNYNLNHEPWDTST